MYNFFSKRLNGNRKGFTLVELLVVMAILAVLIAIAVMNMGTTTVSAKVARHNSQVRELHSAGSMWFANNANSSALAAANDVASAVEIKESELQSFFNGKSVPAPEFGNTGSKFKVMVTKNGEVGVVPGFYAVVDGKAKEDKEATKKLQDEGFWK